MTNKAVCLYSGGLDSTTCLYFSLKTSEEVIALTLDYGQLHKKEIRMACEHARELKVRHHILPVPFPWKGSALLDPAVELPKGRDESRMKDIPATYVPARNSVFLALAASCAEAYGASKIFIGVNALDYSGYPDCRPEYLQAFERMIRLGTKAGIEGKPVAIEAPLLYKKKREIVELGYSLGVPFEKTWSCYEGGEIPCGQCDACYLRAKGFQEAGLKDPLMVDEVSSHRA